MPNQPQPSPSNENYTLGRGIVYFMAEDDSPQVWRDLGNVAEVEFTPTIDKLDHFSSRSGTRTKDKSVVLTRSATLRLVMDEWTPENLALALLGEVTDLASPPGAKQIKIYSRGSVKGAVKYVGSNDEGPNYTYIWESVEFVPSGSLALIGDTWGQLEITGDCLAVGDEFGTITTQ